MSTIPLGASVTAHLVLSIVAPLLPASPPRQSNPELDLLPQPSASKWVTSHARRALDFLISALALTLLFPVLILCWILVRSTSPGPALFRQSRMGRHGQEFILYKFRSMRLQTRGERAGHTVLGDARITPIGAWMRRYKLDEFPQFWNVLRGDMSLVGPRPKLSHHEALRMPYRPGISGHATLAFRHEECMLREVPPSDVDHFYQCVVKPIKARLDTEYMETATLASDLRVLYSTFIRCVHCNPDARAELLDLMRRYTPEHLSLVTRGRPFPHPIPMRHEPPAAALVENDLTCAEDRGA